VRRTVWLTVLAVAGALTAASAKAQRGPSAASLMRGIEQKDWPTYYHLAAALWREGQRDEAAKWLNIAQIRAQAHVRCHQDRTGASLRGSLNEGVGRDINEYLYGSIPRAVRVIDTALEWDAANPNPRLPLPKCAEALEAAREDKLRQRDFTLANVETIRRTRSENGLPNEDD
jgi:hypothetical protein